MGGFFAVAITIVPALNAMPPDRYVYTHDLLGRYSDRVMPFLVLGSAVLGIALAVSTAGTARWSFALAAACMAGVMVVSRTRNVPLNRQVKRLRPEDIGPDWNDPRTRLRDWHLVRTVFAFAGCTLAAVGAVLA
nr:DUF1772 domain-containing protein [Nocardiopsis mwathae]